MKLPFRERPRLGPSLALSADGVLLFLLVFIFLPSVGCSSNRDIPPYPGPGPVHPPPRVWPTTRPTPNPCFRSFAVCTCDLAYFLVSTLQSQLSSADASPYRRMEIASNIEATANQYRERFWTTRDADSGVRA